MRKEASDIVAKLQREGFLAYFAGGYVRDLLMKRESSDIDIATSAKPDDVKRIFTKTIDKAQKFGTIIVMQGSHQFEVTTFRNEAIYLDGRRPSQVSFTNAREDARRRDFTINGIFYDPIKGNFIDYVGGIDDVKKRVISFIGNATNRINEDKLRLIRAVRLKIVLNFQYKDETFQAIKKNAKKIQCVSAERIREEVNKILQSKSRHLGLVELSQSGILKYILPEVERLKGVPQPYEYHHEGDCFTHIYLALKSLRQDAPLEVCWGVLLHDIAKPQTLKKINGKITFNDHASQSSDLARKILQRFKFSKKFIEDVCYIIRYHMSIGQIEQMKPSKKVDFLLNERFELLLELTEADSKGTYPVNLEMVAAMKRFNKMARLQVDITKHLKDEPKLINGNDLKEIEHIEQKKYGEILEEVYDLQIEGKLKTKEEAISFIKDKYINGQ